MSVFVNENNSIFNALLNYVLFLRLEEQSCVCTCIRQRFMVGELVITMSSIGVSKVFYIVFCMELFSIIQFVRLIIYGLS